MEAWGQTDLDAISALSFAGHLTLGKSLHLSERQVPSSTKEEQRSSFEGLL